MGAALPLLRSLHLGGPLRPPAGRAGTRMVMPVLCVLPCRRGSVRAGVRRPSGRPGG